MKKNILFFALEFLFFAFSCQRIDLYQRNVNIPNQSWRHDFEPSYSFHIEDTTQTYNFILTLRHRNLFLYKNIWLQIEVAHEADKASTQDIEFHLASNEVGWLGTMQGDIVEHFIPIWPTPTHLKKGTYHIVVKQLMRDDPLGYVLSVGMRVEKMKP